MQKILVIGCGELGSRHVQSLCKDGYSSLAREIHIVDNNDASINLTKQRVASVSSIFKYVLFYSSSIDNLTEQDFDLVIIATSASNRLVIIKDILSKLTFKHLLLEKVLFQNASELVEAKRLIHEKGINTFVNCPRRNFGHYKKIKEIISGQARIDIKVKGSNWGLACNSIHFIDLWFFLAQPSNYNISTRDVQKKIFDSKRDSFKEIYGKIYVSEGSSSLTLECLAETTNSLSLEVKTEDYLFIIDEIASKIVAFRNGDSFEEELLFEPKYQSDMTGFICDEMISSDSCMLTRFDESFKIHYHFLEAMLEFFKEHFDNSLEKSPIT